VRKEQQKRENKNIDERSASAVASEFGERRQGFPRSAVVHCQSALHLRFCGPPPAFSAISKQSTSQAPSFPVSNRGW
jgi:hypothetical protein